MNDKLTFEGRPRPAMDGMYGKNPPGLVFEKSIAKLPRKEN
jgi:hypothetical protein